MPNLEFKSLTDVNIQQIYKNRLKQISANLGAFLKMYLDDPCTLTEFFEFSSISISAEFYLYLTQISKIREITTVKLQFT